MTRRPDLETLSDAELLRVRDEAQAIAAELREEREADPDDEGNVECASREETEAANLAWDAAREYGRRHPPQHTLCWDEEEDK